MNACRCVFTALGFRKPPVFLGVDVPTWNLFSHFAWNSGIRFRLHLLFSSQKGFSTGILVAAAAVPILFISSSGKLWTLVNILFSALHVFHILF